MIELFISETDPIQLAIKDRMDNMGLACKITIDNARTQAKIKEKGQSFESKDDILRYMDELEEFYRQWYACRCED